MLRVDIAGLEQAAEAGAVCPRAVSLASDEIRKTRPGSGLQGGISPDMLIDTDRGPVPAGALAAGSLVRTLEHGFRPVLWAGLEARAAAAEISAAPIRINLGAFGKSAGTGHVLVAPDQCLVLRHPLNELLFAAPAVMCQARDLVCLPGIGPAHGQAGRHWVHLLFDQREVVQAQGLWLESLVPDMRALRRQDAAAARAIEEAVPSLRYEAGQAAYADLWKRLNAREIKMLGRDGFQA